MSIFAKKQEAPHGQLPLVLLHGDLIDVSRRQIRSSPTVETGGKFLGYIVTAGSKAPDSPYGRAISKVWDELSAYGYCLLLVGSIAPGPKANRTPTSLVPDGQFQAGVFRALEAQEPSLEHLGTWHSHHPNGLAEFSAGDLEHYQSVIVDKNYGPDFFVAALCNGGHGLDHSMVEIFGRKGLHARLGSDRLLIRSGFPSLQESVEQAERAVVSGAVAQPKFPMEAALANHFAVRERHVDDGSVSWVIQNPSGDGFLGAVTQASDPGGHVATSLEVSVQGASLRYDGPASGDIKSLAARLVTIAQKIDSAERRAAKRK